MYVAPPVRMGVLLMATVVNLIEVAVKATGAIDNLRKVSI